MYSTLLFDFYGVINKRDPYVVWLHKNGYERTGPFALAAQEVDQGKITLEEFFSRLSELSSQPADTIRKVFERNEDINYGLVTMIGNLQSSYKLALVSNAPSELLRPTLRRHDLEQYFDRIFISGEIGLRKPSPELFDLVLSHMSAPAKETIFIDDLSEYIEGAKRIGICGLQFISNEKITSDLRNLGVVFS